MATLPSTGDSGRIATLDIIRGIAVMGIFSVNVIAFAMVEAAYFNPAVYGGRTGADLAVWAANMRLISGRSTKKPISSAVRQRLAASMILNQ